MRCVLRVCVTLAFFVGPVVAQEMTKHLDPPGPPKVTQKMYLYELTLTRDQDDGWPHVETEILIRTRVTLTGHPEATSTWALFVDGIDMDGDVENEYFVLDGDELREERKGSQVQIFEHFECYEYDTPSMTIQVWELDSVWSDDLIEKLGKAVGALVSAGFIDGTLVKSEVVTQVAEAIDELCSGESSLGIKSVNVPEGVSSPVSPTVNYRFRTKYDVQPVDSQKCPEEDSRFVAWELLSAQDLSQEDRILLELRAMGWDEAHPFTMSPQEAARRGIHLRAALQSVDNIAVEPGEASPDLDDRKDAIRLLISDIACDILETEVDEGLLGELIPPLVFDAQSALADGQALAQSGDYSGAIDACLEYVPSLLILNHPMVFTDGFEKTDTRMWSITETGDIIIID